MKKQINKELINSWEWLDSYCLTQRGSCDLACGQHAIAVVQIDHFERIGKNLPENEAKELLLKFEKLMETYALEDTIVAKYNESTYVVVLHYLSDRDEIKEVCREIQDAVDFAKQGWNYDLQVTVGAAECHHDPDEGYKCAAKLAMEALQQAKEENKNFILAPDILRHHPLAMAMKKTVIEE